MAARGAGTAARKRLDPAEGYSPLPGVADEMFDADGRMRPAWRPFAEALAGMDRRAVATRFARAERYLRDAGVFYRYEGDGAQGERAWPLAHLPVLLDETEWRAIEAGIGQRAELLETLAADIHGPNHLVGEGFLPPSLIASNPEYLRPLAGIVPPGRHFLHFLAFDLGRGPDGRWWVLGDRAQAPSGAGFALENRVAMRRAFADLHSAMNVPRLAGFFRDFRDTLEHLADRDGGAVAILTPGRFNETYFEHAYIARYLGFLLLEGEDLVVVDDRTMVRTVAGLQPLSVIWRRLDASFADPLELDPASRIGTPGLVGAVRAGHAMFVNALGSGIVESRALLAFMPRLAPRLLGEDLLLPNVATWWCGQEAAREQVIGALDRMMVGPALATTLAFEDPDHTVHGGTLGTAARDRLIGELRRRGGDFAAQEAVSLSTTPVYSGGRLVPRPMSLRVFAARTRAGWRVMPGGFARIGPSGEATAIAMRRGGNAADVWIVGRRPPELVSLIEPRPGPVVREPLGSLPSRAADNLYWLGRYIERAEGAVRILRALHVRLAESADSGAPGPAYARAALRRRDLDPAEPVPEGLATSLANAVSAAGKVRDRFSPDGWLALADLEKTVRQFRPTIRAGDDASRAMTVLLRKLAGFAGLVHENMYRFTGWRFLEAGRRIERALHMADLLRHLTSASEDAGALVLEIGDSVMTHRRRYHGETSRLTVFDLLALDALNPRSVHHQLIEIREQLALLPGGSDDGRLSEPAREAVRLEAAFAVSEPETLAEPTFASLVAELERLSDLMSARYFG